MPVRLSTTLSKISLLTNDVNAKLLEHFHLFMMKNDCSESHRNNTLKTAIAFADFLGPEQSFFQVRKKDKIMAFLDTKIKDGQIDPDKRWITTWNDYLGDLKYLFRWLQNYKIKRDEGIEPSLDPSQWNTPDFVQIKKKKMKRLSPYSESEIWDLEELKTIIKYEPFKRNKAALALMWDLNARNHEVTLLRIKHIRLKERYGEGEIPHQAKTGSGPILLMFSLPYVRDWLNEHPFRNTPEARVICNLNNGAPINPEALWTMMKQLKSRICRQIEADSITDDAEREKLQILLTTKRFNPYCLRHSSISYDSDYLPDYALKKKVRWSMNSKQPSRYIKARMGNDLKQKILLQNGILSENDAKPVPTITDCPRCRLVNCIDNKYCSGCSYPLTTEGYEEIKEQENFKFRQLEDRFNALQSQVQCLFDILKSTADPQAHTQIASNLVKAGLIYSAGSLAAVNG